MRHLRLRNGGFACHHIVIQAFYDANIFTIMKNAMNSQIQEIWSRFDELIKNAETPEARMMGETAKLQAMLLNLRLAPIEHLLERMPGRG